LDAPVIGLRTLDASFQYRMAAGFLASYTLMLEANRLVLNQLRPRMYGGFRRRPVLEAGDVQRTAETLEAQIERLTAIRDSWALRCSPDDPERWVTLYQRLITRYEVTHRRLSGELNRMDPDSRSRLLATDLPCLAHEIKHFKAQLRLWQRRLIGDSAWPRPLAPSPIARPRLRVVQ
jgi:hypothetical protein